MYIWWCANRVRRFWCRMTKIFFYKVVRGCNIPSPESQEFKKYISRMQICRCPNCGYEIIVDSETHRLNHGEVRCDGLNETIGVEIVRDGVRQSVMFCDVRDGDKIVDNPGVTVCGDAHYSGDAEYDGWLFMTRTGTNTSLKIFVSGGS